MNHDDIEALPHMVYHRGFAVRMETYIPDPNVDPIPVIPVFELYRINELRDSIDRGYLDFAASYGDLYRMTPLDISTMRGKETAPKYARSRTLMVESSGYVVEMQIEFSGPGSPWGAGIPLPDSRRSSAVREALKRGDLETAAQYGKVYRLELVDVESVVKPWRPSEKEAERRAKREAETQSAS